MQPEPSAILHVAPRSAANAPRPVDPEALAKRGASFRSFMVEKPQDQDRRSDLHAPDAPAEESAEAADIAQEQEDPLAAVDLDVGRPDSERTATMFAVGTGQDVDSGGGNKASLQDIGPAPRGIIEADPAGAGRNVPILPGSAAVTRKVEEEALVAGAKRPGTAQPAAVRIDTTALKSGTKGTAGLAMSNAAATIPPLRGQGSLAGKDAAARSGSGKTIAATDRIGEGVANRFEGAVSAQINLPSTETAGPIQERLPASFPFPTSNPGPDLLSSQSSETALPGGALADALEPARSVPLPELKEGIARHIAHLVKSAEMAGIDVRAAKAGADLTTELELAPAELGRLRIMLNTGDQGLNVSVTIERPESVEAVRRHLEGLHRALLSAGLTLDSVDIGTGDPRGESPSADRNAPEQAGAAGDPTGAPPLPDQQAALPSPSHRGRLDIRL